MLNMLPHLFSRNPPCHNTSHSLTNPAHTLFNMSLFWIGEAQAEVLLATTIDVEGFADRESHLLVRCFSQEGTRTHICREAAPEMKTSSWVINTHFFWPVCADGLQHQIALVLVAA